jgi:hypothetical protein
MRKIKFKSIPILLIFLMAISATNVFGEETTENTFCYDVPDTVRSLSVVTN